MKLKKLFSIILAGVVLSTAMYAQSSKKLVLYFSHSGTTERMAKIIAESTGADLFKIEPVKPYPTSYRPCTEVVKEELDKGIVRDVKAVPDFSKYDTIFVGTPVWCHTAPTVMTNLLETHKGDFKGKTVIPFCTNMATYIKETLDRLEEATPLAKHLEGHGTNNPNKNDIDAWLKKIRMIK